MKPEDVIEFRKRSEEFIRQYEKDHPEKYESSHKLDEWVKERKDRGEIVNPFIRSWLEAEIAAARGVLIIGMLLTVLIKGQVVIWAIMYIAYRARVKAVKEKALEADRREIL